MVQGLCARLEDAHSKHLILAINLLISVGVAMCFKDVERISACSIRMFRSSTMIKKVTLLEVIVAKNVCQDLKRLGKRKRALNLFSHVVSL